MRTIYTAAAYWSWVVLFLVWLPGYFLRKPAVRRPHRVWARLALGTNWSGIGTVQRGHELVPWGPYAVIRHPIYAGLLAAVLIRVSDEDALMAEEFPAAHRAYRARTKALIPFVWYQDTGGT